MKRWMVLAGTLVALVGYSIPARVFGQDWPVKHNPAFNAAAAAAATTFDSFNTGVVITVKSASIAKDGTITTQFTLTDSKGAGLDINGVLTAGTESLGFVAAYIPTGQAQYVAYTTTVDKATINSNPSQTQAGLDTAGAYALVDAASGTYNYTFGTKAPVTFDPTATHSIGAQASRSLAAYGYPTAFTANSVFNFVPNGSKVTVTRDVVNEAACNTCHNPISAHGGPRTEVAYCVMCHTPQSTNPDTLNTVDFKVFIHKLHMGSSLPSVVAGGDYFLEHRGAKSDFSAVVFPQDIRNCTKCHAAGPAQSGNWSTNPSRAACGSCHDNVNFATGLNHVNLIQSDDTQCAACHASTQHTEFDASIPGAHIVPNNSVALPGIVLKIVSLANTRPGVSPTVTFQVTNKAGAPVDITKLTTFRVVLGGSNVDYQTGSAGIRVSETPTAITATAGANGVYTYTMTNKIPASAVGSYTITLEAVNTVTLLAGTTQQMTASDMAVPVESYFTVDSSPMLARRQVVSTAKCSACHQNLGIVHGGSRGNTQECVVCHNPTLTDGTSMQSVSFATQIHAIHRGSNLTNSYIIGGANFQSLLFPGDLRDCTTCHINNSYQVDNVGAVASVATPGRFTPTTPPISAACQGCHDDKATAAHALANSNALGETCITCHGIGQQFAVDTVHARTQQ